MDRLRNERFPAERERATASPMEGGDAAYEWNCRYWRWRRSDDWDEDRGLQGRGPLLNLEL